MLNLKQIRIFLAASKHLHFTQAAEELSMAQPAVSKAIFELEQAIQVPLFDRSTRVVRLTKAGEVFAKEAARVIDQLDRAVALTKRAEIQITDTLRIGYTELAINGRLSEVVRKFRDLEPDVRIELVFMPTLEQRKALLNGTIDIGFMQGVFDHADYVSHLLQRDQLFVVTAITHRLAGRKEVNLADLADEPFVFGDTEIWGLFREAVFNSCRLRGLDPKVIQEATNGVGILGLVAAGIGISIFATLTGKLSRTDVASVAIADQVDPLSTFFVLARDDTFPVLERFVAVALAHSCEGSSSELLPSTAAPGSLLRLKRPAP
jgi:DNA-binding transcriptional LysR family regulator